MGFRLFCRDSYYVCTHEDHGDSEDVQATHVPADSATSWDGTAYCAEHAPKDALALADFPPADPESP